MNEIINELKSLIDECYSFVIPTNQYHEYVGNYVDKVKYNVWHTKAMTVTSKILPSDSPIYHNLENTVSNSLDNAKESVAILEGIIDYLEKGIIQYTKGKTVDAYYALNTIFSRFTRVVRQLRYRHDNRPTVDVEDEYDVQDLLHALLKLFFDDIRPEEWTPSYAGKSARMDFLLKNEQTVIEIKMTRKGLSDKELGDQLIVDAERYQSHPDCNKLICFIYDPESRVANPDGLIQDLNSRYNGFVDVVIQPMG